MPSPLFRTLILGAIASFFCVFSPSEANAAPNAKKSKARIAVLYFDHIGNDAELKFMRKGLTQMLISDLSEGDDLVLVERTDLEMVLQELKLSKTKFISRSTANRIGKLLGAQYLVTGSYHGFRGKLHITAKVIDTELGTVEGVTTHGVPDKFLDLESRLASELRGTIAEVYAAKNLSKKARFLARRTRIRNKKRALARAKLSPKPIASASLVEVSAKTVSQYGKALDSIDQGDKKLAMKELGEIAKSDPEFSLAADELKVLLR